MESILQLLTVMCVFVIVLAVSYFTTRWIGNFQKVQMNGTDIELISAARLNQNQYIQIVRLGSQYMALGVSKDHITVLCTLTESELHLNESDGGKSGQDSFVKILEAAKSKLTSK